MKSLYLTIAACIALFPAAAQAQGFASMNADAEKMQAKMNRDNYPYSVMSNGPILPPEEKRKIREYQIKYEQYQKAKELDKVRQFRTMSADERRYVIESQGFPRAMQPGYK